jgi:hypothetical protein
MDTVLPDFTRLYCSFARKLSTDVQYWSLLQPVFRIWILLISLLTFRMPTKKFCCLNFFFFFNFWRYIYIIFKDKKSKKKSQSSRNQGFSYYFCLVIEGSESGSIPLTNDPDPDPGGPKTCGSGGFGPDSHPDPQHWLQLTRKIDLIYFQNWACSGCSRRVTGTPWRPAA